MDPESAFLLRKFIFDFICLGILGATILVLKVFATPFQRGFFCDDDSIKYPFKDSTINNITLYVVGIGLPIVTILGVEYIKYLKDRSRRPPLTFLGMSIPSWIFLSYQCIGIFGFGAASSQTITDVGKYSIGRLRPHFFAVCQPDVNCSLPSSMHTYHTDFHCLSGNTKLIREARLSFPSGHSSFSAYTMIFVIIYLQTRLTWNGSFLAKHFLQLICFLMTWGTALSRVSDNKHHWSDVLSGLIIGMVVALLTYPFVVRVFRHSNKKNYVEANNGTTMHAANDKP